MNAHAKAPTPLAKAHILQAPTDPRLERIKMVAVSVPFMASLLQMDGTFALKMSGWPEGAEVIAAAMTPDGSGFALAIYHPSFPVHLVGPEFINITYEKVYVLLEKPEDDEDEDDGE